MLQCVKNHKGDCHHPNKALRMCVCACLPVCCVRVCKIHVIVRKCISIFLGGRPEELGKSTIQTAKQQQKRLSLSTREFSVSSQQVTFRRRQKATTLPVDYSGAIHATFRVMREGGADRTEAGLSSSSVGLSEKRFLFGVGRKNTSLSVCDMIHF